MQVIKVQAPRGRLKKLRALRDNSQVKEDSRSILIETLLFGIIALTAAWPLAAMIDAVARYL
jgi:hypothetical protein